MITLANWVRVYFVFFGLLFFFVTFFLALLAGLAAFFAVFADFGFAPSVFPVSSLNALAASGIPRLPLSLLILRPSLQELKIAFSTSSMEAVGFASNNSAASPAM